MRTERARRAPLRLALVVTGLALVAAGVWRHQSMRPPAPDLSKVAAPLQARVAQAVAAEAAALEPQAAAAVAVTELRSAWKMRADRATFQDLLENEEWWAPFRARFPLGAVVEERAVVAALGPRTDDLTTNDIVKAARERGTASGLVALADGRLFLGAASRLPAGKDGKDGKGVAAPTDLPVVLLGAPLDDGVLQRVAGQTGDIVGLSDGTTLMTVTGPPSSRALAAALVGHEREPAGLADGRVGVAWPVGGRTWLLAISPPTTAPPRDLFGVWLALAGLGVALLGLALRAPARAASDASPSAPASGHTSIGVGSSVADEPREASSRAAPVARTIVYSPTMAADAAGAAQAAVSAPEPARHGLNQMGRYRLIERIGEGGMAEIFFAAAYGVEDFVRHFVVKRMHPHMSRQREVVNQFIDEAQLQAGLVHSNIVPVFDFGKADDDEYFMALEYIHGRDLGKVVQQHLDLVGRPLSTPISFYIVHEVLEALSYAHTQTDKTGNPLEIVHRDVAPGNVLISYPGEVKLTDFGIAKAERRVSRTEVGMVKGNANFMSPEQARGEPVDARTDIFSAGLVLYYCMTSQLLYRGETTLNRLLRAAVGPATSQFSQIEQLPPAAAQILRRALAIDPAKRYATAEEFKHELVAESATRRDMAQLMDVLFPAAQRRDLR
jgi:tRNA A-37 threonylcarbamoyl transferase component Bud32